MARGCGWHDADELLCHPLNFSRLKHRSTRPFLFQIPGPNQNKGHSDPGIEPEWPPIPPAPAAPYGRQPAIVPSYRRRCRRGRRSTSIDRWSGYSRGQIRGSGGLTASVRPCRTRTGSWPCSCAGKPCSARRPGSRAQLADRGNPQHARRPAHLRGRPDRPRTDPPAELSAESAYAALFDAAETADPPRS